MKDYSRVRGAEKEAIKPGQVAMLVALCAMVMLIDHTLAWIWGEVL